MPLRFGCESCGKEIVVKYLKVGDTACCPFCGSFVNVPPSAEEIDAESTALVTARSQVQPAPQAAQPTVIPSPIMARDIKGILAETMRIFGTNFVQIFIFSSIAVVVALSSGIPFWLLVSKHPNVWYHFSRVDSSKIAIGVFALVVGTLLAISIATALISILGAWQYVGAEFRTRPVYQIALRRLGKIIAAILLVLAFEGLMAASLVLLPRGAVVLFGSAGALLVIPMLVLIIYLSFRICLAPVSAAIENCGPLVAIKRSWNLVEGHWWKVAVCQIIIWLVMLPIALIFSQSSAFASVVPSLFMHAAFILCQTVLYFDLRVRKEGYERANLEAELALLLSP